MAEYPSINLDTIIFNSNNFKSKDDILDNLNNIFVNKNENDIVKGVLQFEDNIKLIDNKGFITADNTYVLESKIKQLHDLSENKTIEERFNNIPKLILNPVNGNICSMDTSGNVVNNNISLTTDKTLNTTSDLTLPTSMAIKTYIENQISQINTNSTIGQAINFFFNNTPSIIQGYETIDNSPSNLLQDIESLLVNNSEILLHSYISQNLNRTKINKGVFNFVFYASVSDITLYSYVKAQLYKRDISGNETLLIDDIKSNDINVLYPNVNTFTATGTLYNDVVLLLTDNIVIKIYLGTTATKNITVYFYHNGNTCSFFSSPFLTSHNENDNIQGGNTNERFHLSLGQYNNIIVPATSNNNGYLTNTDYNTFNNKQNKNTIFYQNLYVQYQFGNDNNNGFDYLNPKKTIQNALDSANANSGINLIISGFTYPESINITRQNITISSIIGDEIGGLINITGDVFINSISSSVRLIGLSMNNLDIIGNCNVYIQNCKINNLTIKGTGYKEIRQSVFTSTISVYSICTVNIINNNNMRGLVCDVGAQINISNNLLCGPITIYNGCILGINNTPIYAVSNFFSAIFTNGCYIYITNSQILNPDNTIGKITITNNSFYTILNTTYNKSTSVFTNSTKLNREANFENISLDNLRLEGGITLNNSVNINQNELFYLSNVSSNIQTQLNNKPNLNTNNIFLNENTFNGTTYIAKSGNNHYFEMASVSQNNVTFMDVHCNANFNTDYDIRLNFNNDDNTNNIGRGNLSIECNRTQIPNLRLTNNLILNDNTNITNNDIKQLYNNKFKNYYGTLVLNPVIGSFNRVTYNLSQLNIPETSISYSDYKKIRITGSNPVVYLNNGFFCYGGNPKKSDNSAVEIGGNFDEVDVFYGSTLSNIVRLSIVISIYD